MQRRAFLALSFCGTVHGQSGPSRLPDHADVPYGPYPRNVLDLWQARSPIPAPLVIYLHGGEFFTGDKSSLDPALLDRLLAAGLSVAALNLRYSTQFAPYPFPMLDAARGVQFLRYHAREWNLDPARFGATGISSGGAISLWLGFHDDLSDSRKADPVLRQSSRLSAMAVQDAQTTFNPRVMAKLVGEAAPKHQALELLFGFAAYQQRTEATFNLFDDASPATHLSKDDPPALLIYTEPDEPVPPDAPPGTGIHHPRFGFYLKEKMDTLGIECTVAVLDKPDLRPKAAGMIVEFFRRHLTTL